MKVVILFTFVFLSMVSFSEASCGCKNQGSFKRAYNKIVKRKVDIFGDDLSMELRSANEDVKLVEDDQVFSSEDFALFSGYRAFINKEKRWPQNTIPYRFRSMSSRQKRKIRNALADLSKKTGDCVKFTEINRTPSTGGYIMVASERGCFSNVGNMNRKQTLSLGYGCVFPDTIQHEFIHALGFYHEQSRPDRDEYIKINWSKMESQGCDRFPKCKGCSTNTPYDVKSIMHYQGTSFGCTKGQITLEDRKNPNNKVGSAGQLTEYDIKKIRDYYEC